MIAFTKAKINLGLWVTKKRTDGYHNIESIFYPIDLHDIIEVLPSHGASSSFCFSGLIIPGETEDNLAVKAYLLLKDHYQLPPIRLHLHKLIPIGSGLGGGSGDAATTLLLLNDLFQLRLTREQLSEHALSLGSDVPFFIDPRPALVTGKGEHMEAITLDLANWLMVLVIPGLAVNTREAYQLVVPEVRTVSLRDCVHAPISEWKSLIHNDFEKAIFTKHPLLAEVRQGLYDSGALYASMSGSGSALFGLFERGHPGISQCINGFRPKGMMVIPCN